MNPSQTHALVARCPIFFSLRSQGPQVASICMGIECGDGWYAIIAAWVSVVRFT